MTFKRLVFVCACILIVGLGAYPRASAEHSGTAYARHSKNRFGGTWWLTTGPPAERPIVLTMSDSGTFVLQDSIDGGGHTFSGVSFSLTQGTWKRSGRHARLLGLRFVYDVDGKTRAVERIRLSLSLAPGSDGLEGEYQIEEMGCTEQSTPVPFTVPVCPDPSLAPTEILRGPATISGVRVPIHAPIGGN